MTIFAVNSPMLDELKALNAEVGKRYYAVIVVMNYRGAIRVKRAAHAARRLTLELVRQPLLGSSPQLLEAAPYSTAIPKWHARCLGLACMTRQGLMPEKIPPTFDSSPLRARQRSCITSCVHRSLADSFSANLLQIVFLEVNPFAEEAFFGIARRMRLISDRCQFNAAYVIGDLGQVIRCRRDIAVDDGFFGNRALDCAVNRAFDYFLAVVVVNLNGVERLEEFEIVAYCQIDISTYFVFKGLLGRELAFQVSKCSIFEVNFLSKDSKRSEELSSGSIFHQRILVMPSYDGREVKCSLRKPGVSDGLLVSFNILIDIDSLIMENEGDQITFGSRSNITGLVDEDREFVHCEPFCRNKKMPGDSPRLLRQPSMAERYLVYITGQDALSSRNYNKQTFDVKGLRG